MKKILIVFILLILFSFINNVSGLSVVVHVPEKYTDVEAGERFYFEIEVKYPENPQRKDLRLNYEILTSSGKIIAQSKVLKAIETQASFMDFIVIPESAQAGMHIIKITISDYESLTEDVAASFQVSKKSDQLRLYFFILIGVLILIGIAIVVAIRMKKRR